MLTLTTTHKKLQTHIIDTLPKLVKPLVPFIPHILQEKLLLKCLHSLFAEAITDGDLEFLAKKWLKISIIDLGIDWWLSYENGKLIMASEQVVKQGINADVCFSANGDDLLLIAGRKEDPDTLFFQRRLVISGDTELGLEIKNLIDAMDLDNIPSKIHRIVEFSATTIANVKVNA